MIKIVAVASMAGTVSGCATMMVSGSGSLDVGSYMVSEADPGIGAAVDVGMQTGMTSGGFGGYLSAALLGYQSAGDADPIFITTADIRYRAPLGGADSRSGFYWAAGSGAGPGLVAGVRSLAVPLHGEIGHEFRSGSLLVAVGLRNRLILLYSGGSPPLDVVNSLQAGVSLGWD